MDAVVDEQRVSLAKSAIASYCSSTNKFDRDRNLVEELRKQGKK